ncbi:GGDEF domain-containing protein [Bilophila wadsworthia]|uniref:GGDEF domain-containing protein n=1 Tax=Bilophila wadsworthia TaxID=35833 RepID=UPI00266CC0C5|nr:GGDEF domain-containing protein [Bilophila wadsworthia]
MAHRDLKRRAEHDGLTGLLTRNALVRRLKPVLAGERAFFLGIMDIDDFRGINDTFGHSAGDVVLRRMDAVLQEQLGDADMASRIGGDEFVFVMPGIVGKESAESLLPRICAASVTHEDVPCPISVSIGFAAFPNDGAAFEVLHKEAGKALYHAKRQGKRQCAFYGELPEPCPRALNGMIV